jgi:hypothetical protein
VWGHLWGCYFTTLRNAAGRAKSSERQHTRVGDAPNRSVHSGHTGMATGRRHLEPDPHWTGRVAEIRNLRSQGHALRGIAATLNNRVHRARRGYRMAAGIGSRGDKAERPGAARENYLESFNIRKCWAGWFESHLQKRSQQEIHKTQY